MARGSDRVKANCQSSSKDTGPINQYFYDRHSGVLLVDVLS